MRIGYSQRRAVVVVEGATVDFARRPTTMIIIGIVLALVGLAYLCWLLFALAVYALPLFALCGRPHKANYVAFHICGAHATSVSVEYGSGLLTPHILAWMIAVHHHGWRTDHARRTIRAASRCRSLSRRALHGIPRAIPAAGARGRLLASDAGKYGLGVACCGGSSSPRRREHIVRAAEEDSSPAHPA